MKYVCMYFVYEKMQQNVGVDTLVIPPLDPLPGGLGIELEG